MSRLTLVRNPRRLYETKTLAQLVKMAEALPAQLSDDERRLSYAIDRAIGWHLEDRRNGAKAYGSPFT